MILFIPHPANVKRLEKIFELGQGLEDDMFRLQQSHGKMMVNRAKMMVSATSGRVAGSLEERTERDGSTIVTTVGSEMVGYPKDESDHIGDAAEAKRRGWATLPHRIELGYPGQGQAWNPRAGWTDPHPFLMPAFEEVGEMYVASLRDIYLRQILSGSGW